MNMQGSTRPVHFESRLPQAGKTLLRLIVIGTRRATIKARAACQWPAQRFSCDLNGLLQRLSARTDLLDQEMRVRGLGTVDAVTLSAAANRIALAAVVVSLLSGCGYSLAGRGSFLPEYIRTIGVPQFGNNTPVFDIEQRITDKVRSELIGRGRYKVEPNRTGVDGLLTGEIMAITLTPAAFNDQQQATRYALTLVVKVEFRDLKTDKVLWSNPGMQFTEQYDVATITTGLDVTAFFGQDVNAVERLATEFARALVSAILEAF
jgi:hypothetical protein